MAGEYLVFYTYKGHKNSIVIEATEFTVATEFRKRVEYGQIDKIYSPGEWHYDPVTENPVSNYKE